MALGEYRPAGVQNWAPQMASFMRKFHNELVPKGVFLLKGVADQC